jgi:hypothetical protein
MQSVRNLINPRYHYRRVKRIFRPPVEDYPNEKGSPVFIHCPHGGPDTGLTPEVRKNFRNLSTQVVRNRRGLFYTAPEGVEFVTYSNLPQATLLERCCLAYGVPLRVVGRDVVRWGWISKVDPLLENIKSKDCTADVVVALDATDVLMVNNPATLLDSFESYGCDALFCNTIADYPTSRRHYEFEVQTYYTHPLHAHLSAGAFMARKGPLIAYLEEISAGFRARHPEFFVDGRFEDQLAWRDLHLRYYPKIKVDYLSRIFLRYDAFRGSDY